MILKLSTLKALLFHCGVIPFGLTHGSYQRENPLENQYQYNGKELQDELSIGWFDYGQRMFHSDLCRFFSADRFAGNLDPKSVKGGLFSGSSRALKTLAKDDETYEVSLSDKVDYKDGDENVQTLKMGDLEFNEMKNCR